MKLTKASSKYAVAFVIFVACLATRSFSAEREYFLISLKFSFLLSFQNLKGGDLSYKHYAFLALFGCSLSA